MSTANGDSRLDITGSIVGIVALLISVSTIVQALFVYFLAYRNAPAELSRFTSSISNTMDENSHRLRSGHIPGPIALDLGDQTFSRGKWNEMIQEYFNAHLELADELDKIKRQDKEANASFSWNRLLWVFRRKDLEESVRRVETLRMRKMAVALNALVDDVSSIKTTLERIEARIPQGPINLPLAKPPVDPELDLGRPLNIYSRSLLGESVTSIVRTSLDSA